MLGSILFVSYIDKTEILAEYASVGCWSEAFKFPLTSREKLKRPDDDTYLRHFCPKE